MAKKLDFEINPKEFQFYFEICWICKNSKKCPMDYECETLANLDNDNTDHGVDQA